MWPSLSQSPILTEFAWSELVYSAIRLNADLISPRLGEYHMPNAMGDLMAIHVRRGDFEEHCYRLASSKSDYQGWNMFPALPDKFIPPGDGIDEDSVNEMYQAHCWPDFDRIVQRVRDARHDWEAHPGVSPLRRLYILTNGKEEWIKELKARLQESQEWDSLNSSRDLVLSKEQKYIAQAIDMAIAERAALFVGNGVSASCGLNLHQSNSYCMCFLVLKYDCKYRPSSDGAPSPPAKQQILVTGEGVLFTPACLPPLVLVV